MSLARSSTNTPAMEDFYSTRWTSRGDDCCVPFAFTSTLTWNDPFSFIEETGRASIEKPGRRISRQLFANFSRFDLKIKITPSRKKNGTAVGLSIAIKRNDASFTRRGTCLNVFQRSIFRRRERNKIKRKKGNGILPRISELRNRCPASVSHATIIRYRYLYVLPDLAGKLTRIVAR